MRFIDGQTPVQSCWGGTDYEYHYKTSHPQFQTQHLFTPWAICDWTIHIYQHDYYIHSMLIEIHVCTCTYILSIGFGSVVLCYVVLPSGCVPLPCSTCISVHVYPYRLNVPVHYILFFIAQPFMINSAQAPWLVAELVWHRPRPVLHFKVSNYPIFNGCEFTYVMLVYVHTSNNDIQTDRLSC